MTTFLKNLTFVIVFLLIAGCGLSHNRSEDDMYSDTSKEQQPIYYIGEPYRIKGILYVPQEYKKYSECGAAAQYIKKEGSHLTTNQEIFNSNLLTASHKTLPLPSIIRITNLENNNTAIARVNDRGPHVNNRLIDVSPALAAALEFQAKGTTMVRVDLLEEESKQLKREIVKTTGQQSDSPKRNPISFHDGSEIRDIDFEIVRLGSHEPIYTPDPENIPIYKNGLEINSEEFVEPVESTTNPDFNVIETTTDSALSLWENSDKKDKKSVDYLKENSDSLNEEINIQNKSNVEDIKSVSIDKETSSKKVEKEEKEKQSIQKGENTCYYTIQIGAFKSMENIRNISEKLSKKGYTFSYQNKKDLVAIQVGQLKTISEAKEMLDKLHQEGYPESQIKQSNKRNCE